MLEEEQIKSIKEQLIKQIDSTFPEDKKEQAISYIKSLNTEQLEEFLKKNKLIKSESENDDGKDEKEQCIMCAVANKQMKSESIYEDENYLAVLELNPLAKGHTLLIPKKHLKDIKELDKKAEIIAKRIGKHIAKKLGTKESQTRPSAELGHALISILPTYEGEKLERKKATPEQLKEIAAKIGQIKPKNAKVKTVKSETPKINKENVKPAIIHLPRRIP